MLRGVKWVSLLSCGGAAMPTRMTNLCPFIHKEKGRRHTGRRERERAGRNQTLFKQRHAVNLALPKQRIVWARCWRPIETSTILAESITK